MPPDKNNQGPFDADSVHLVALQNRGAALERPVAQLDHVQSDTSVVPFILDDGTGQCLIDPRGAEVFPSATDVWYGSTEWPEVRIPDGQGLFGKLADLLLSGGQLPLYRISLAAA